MRLPIQMNPNTGHRKSMSGLGFVNIRYRNTFFLRIKEVKKLHNGEEVSQRVLLDAKKMSWLERCCHRS